MPFIGDMINLGANLSESVWALDRAEKLAVVGRELWAQGKPWRPLIPRHELEILMKYPEAVAILRRIRAAYLSKNKVDVRAFERPKEEVRARPASYHDLKSLCVYDLQVLRDFLLLNPKKNELFGFVWPAATFEECNKLLRIRLYDEAWRLK